MTHVFCCIGHITLDKVITPATTVYMPGGTAYYFCHAMAGLHNSCLLVTAVADGEMESLSSLRERGIAVQRLHSEHTVFFENRYGHQANERTQKVLQEADAFPLQQVQDIEATTFHLGPLLAGDVPDEMIPALAAKGIVSLDVQGLLRKVETSRVVTIDWERKKEMLPSVHFLKASENEAQVLTGLADVHEGAKQLADWGVKEVIITLGDKGSVIYTGDVFFHIPAYEPASVTDATGCGDTYMAGYLACREKGLGIQPAGEFAAAIASLKIASSGPFTGTEADVNTMLQKAKRCKESIY